MDVLNFVINDKAFCLTGNPPGSVTQPLVKEFIVQNGGKIATQSTKADYLLEGPPTRTSDYPTEKLRDAQEIIAEWENSNLENRVEACPIEIIQFGDFLKLVEFRTT